jgi:hypothetical protein
LKAGSPDAAEAVMEVQWWRPLRRQQAGRLLCESGVEARRGTMSGEPNAISSVMARIRRIERV